MELRDAVTGWVKVMDGSSSVTNLILEHALAVAREKGWNVSPVDVIVAYVPAYNPHLARQVNYWEVKVKIRAALNKHRPLTRDGQITGIVRLSGDALLDTLKESDDTLQARLAAGDLG